MTWNENDLLDAFREEHGPPAIARDRLEARLREVTTGADPRATAEGDQATSHPWLRRGVVAALAMAAGIAATCALSPKVASELQPDVPALVPDAAESDGQLTGRAKHSPHPAAARSPRANRPAPATPDIPAEPRDETSPAPLPPAAQPAGKAAARPPARRTPPADSPTAAAVVEAPKATTITEEAAAIGRARAALAEGKPQTALARIRAYRTRFSTPILAEEADAVAAMATCHGATPDVASAAARTFTAAHAGSLFRKQVERSCTAVEKKSTPMQRPRATPDIHEQ